MKRERLWKNVTSVGYEEEITQTQQAASGNRWKIRGKIPRHLLLTHGKYSCHLFDGRDI